RRGRGEAQRRRRWAGQAGAPRQHCIRASLAGPTPPLRPSAFSASSAVEKAVTTALGKALHDPSVFCRDVIRFPATQRGRQPMVGSVGYRRGLAVVGVVVAALAGPAAAEQKTWTGVAGSWTDGNNWSPAAQPGANDDVVIASGSAGVCVDTLL